MHISKSLSISGMEAAYRAHSHFVPASWNSRFISDLIGPELILQTETNEPPVHIHFTYRGVRIALEAIDGDNRSANLRCMDPCVRTRNVPTTFLISRDNESLSLARRLPGQQVCHRLFLPAHIVQYILELGGFVH